MSVPFLVKTTINTVGSSAIGAASKVASNALEGKRLTSGVGKAALVNGGAGMTGSLISSGGQALQNIINNSKWNNATTAERIMSNVVQPTSDRTSNIVGGFNAIGTTVSNSSPAIENQGTDNLLV